MSSQHDEPTTLYLYGWIAWVWRVLVFVGLASSALMVSFAIRFGELWFLLAALPLAVPCIVLPWMLATRIDRISAQEVVVTNLFFVRRTVHQKSLGPPRVRLTAQGAIRHIPAPRAWIPVRGSWPIYVDLWATIPDPGAFRAFFKLPKKGH